MSRRWWKKTAQAGQRTGKLLHAAFSLLVKHPQSPLISSGELRLRLKYELWELISFSGSMNSRPALCCSLLQATFIRRSDAGVNTDPDIFSILRLRKSEEANRALCTNIHSKRPDYTRNRAVFSHHLPADYTKLEFCIIGAFLLDRRHLQRHSDGRQGFHDSSNSGITLAAFHPGYDRLLHSAQSLKLFLRDPLFTPCPDRVRRIRSDTGQSD